MVRNLRGPGNRSEAANRPALGKGTGSLASRNSQANLVNRFRRAEPHRWEWVK